MGSTTNPRQGHSSATRSTGGLIRALLLLAVALLFAGTVPAAAAGTTGQAPDRAAVRVVPGTASGAGSGATADGYTPMSLSDCASGRLCLWAWPNYDSDGLWRWRIGAGTWQLEEGDIMNEVSSAVNRRSAAVELIDSACPEWVVRLDPGERVSDLSDVERPAPCGGTFNNRIDKVRLY